MTTPAAGLIRYQVGDRVQLHPAANAHWVQDDRYGYVERLPKRRGDRNYVYVRMEVSRRLHLIHLSNLLPIEVGS
jgi:hypothetical protein